MNHEITPGNPPTWDPWAKPEPASQPGPPIATSRRQLIGAGIAGAALSLTALVGVAFVNGSSNATALSSSTTAPSTTSTNAASPQGVGGKVTAISGSTITISAPQHTGRCAPDVANPSADTNTTTYTVTTTDSTTFAKRSKGQVSDFSKGDNVMVVKGESKTAKRIDEVPNFGPSQQTNGTNKRSSRNDRAGRALYGTVESIKGTTVVVREASGKTTTVSTNAKTVVTVLKKVDLASVKVGDRVRVDGTVSGTNVSAQHVIIGDLRPPRPPRHDGQGPGFGPPRGEVPTPNSLPTS